MFLRVEMTNNIEKITLHVKNHKISNLSQTSGAARLKYNRRISDSGNKQVQNRFKKNLFVGLSIQNRL